MALPKVVGDNPEKINIVKDVWTHVAQAVNIARIQNNFGSTNKVLFTYVKTGDAAPVGLGMPTWNIPNDFFQFTDSVTTRDLYLYPVDEDAEVTIES